MIGKIVKGTSFSGCVNYVLKEDKSRLLKAVGVYGSPEEIAEQFELQTLLNDKVKNKVGHISLSFSAEDGDRIRDDDGLMLKIAHDYMKLMGIENTQFISVYFIPFFCPIRVIGEHPSRVACCFGEQHRMYPIFFTYIQMISGHSGKTVSGTRIFCFQANIRWCDTHISRGAQTGKCQKRY